MLGEPRLHKAVAIGSPGCLQADLCDGSWDTASKKPKRPTIPKTTMSCAQESEESLKEVEGRTRELKECNQRLAAHVQVRGRLRAVGCPATLAAVSDRHRRTTLSSVALLAAVFPTACINCHPSPQQRSVETKDAWHVSSEEVKQAPYACGCAFDPWLRLPRDTSV